MKYVHFRGLVGLLAVGLLPAAAAAQIVTAPGAGHSPAVRVIEANGTDRTIMAYDPAFGGGVRVAVGDVTGDGVVDIITGAGPGGGPHVRIWDGVDHHEVAGFFAYDPAFPGGVNVAAGDVDGDGRADIITGAGAGGGPHVRIWSGATFTELGGFFAYDPAFPGGVSVAAGDVNGDGRADIITGAGPGGGPHVRVWSGTDLTELGGFFAYSPAFAGGVHVAAGDVDGDGRADVITGAGAGGGPHVRIWSGATFAELGGFFAYDPGFPGGVTVGAVDLTYDGRVEIITGAGPGAGPLVAIWHGVDLSLLGAYFAYSPSFPGGVFIGSVGGSSALRFTSGNSTSFTAGTPGTFAVTTTGGAAIPALTVTGTLPAGITFTDNGDRTGTLAGTPGPATGGTYNLTFRADNGSVPPVTQAFTLTVNQAPAITSAASTTFLVGTPGNFTVTTTGFPVPTIGATVGLPSGVTFSDNGNGTATIAGTPDPGTGGTYEITISAMNGVGAVASQSFTLTVQQAPTFTSGASATFVVGTPGSFGVTTSATPAVTTIVRTGALPSGVTFTDNGNGTATLAGTPAAGSAGTYPLTLTASNGVGAPAVQNFTLTVHQAPAITSVNSTSFTIGAAGTFTVTTTGFPTAGIARGGDALPAGVTFVDNANGTGTLSGTPGAGTTGAYALTFTASNGIGSPAVQNFTLTVACPAVSVLPAAGALPGGMYQQPYSQVFTAVGGTGHTFAVTAGALPAGLTLASGGALTGSPTVTGNFSFTITATNAFGCPGSAAYTLAVVPNAADEAFSNGVGNTQYVVAPSPTSPTPAVFAVGTVLSNDAGPGTLSAGPAVISSVNGGTVAMSSNGAFVYTPAIGFAGPSDTFAYTLTDGNGITDTATVTINLTGVVWYVNSAAANGDGRSHSPFNDVSNAQAPSLPGQVIYVHTGAGTVPGAITLKASQTLWGAGLPFTLNGLAIPFTGYPTLLGTVTLANDVFVSSVRINSASGPAIQGSGLTGNEVLSSVNVLGGTSGIVLTNIGGTLAFSIVSLTGLTTGPALQVNGGAGTLFGRLDISNTAGRSVDIQNKTGGIVVLGAPITDTGQGIFLNNNPGTTINFEGGLSLSTGSSPAFTATNSGTINVIQDNVATVNTLATTTGTALNVTNTTIGGSGVTFRSISANGAANGIVLNNTGTSGGLTVTGTGTVAGSGGTIQNATGPGIALTSTAAISLNRMNIQNGGDDGIRGSGVAGFNLANVSVTANGNAVGESGIELTELTGAGGIASSTISGSSDRNVHIANTTGALTAFNVTGSTFSATSSVTGDDGFLIENNGSGSMAVSITGSTFVDNKGDHFQAATSASASGSLAVTFNNNTLTTTPANDPNVIGGGITLSPSGSADLTFTISNNNIQQAFDEAINVNLGTASTVSASMAGTISNNIVGTPGEVDSGSESGTGISVTSNGAGTTTVSITDNEVYQYANPFGILVNHKEGSSTMDATVTGNTVANPGSFALNGIRIDSGATTGDSGTLCVALTGNSVAGSGPGLDTDIRLRQRFNTTVRLPGYAGGNSDTAAVNSFVAGNNPGADVSSAHNVGGGGGGFVGGAGCIVP